MTKLDVSDIFINRKGDTGPNNLEKVKILIEKMKTLYIENPQTGNAKKYSAIIGYDIDRAIARTEPPLEKVLRQAGIGYFKREDVHKKMDRLEFQMNLRAGFSVFDAYLAEESRSLHFLFRLLTFLCLSSVPLAIVGLWKGYNLLQIITVGEAIVTIIFLFVCFLMDFDITPDDYSHVLRWNSEDITQHRLPIPEQVLAVAAEIKMRVPPTENPHRRVKFNLLVLSSYEQRKRYYGFWLEKTYEVNRNKRKFPSPDPFLVVNKSSRLEGEDGGVVYTNEEFVVAYYEKAEFTSKVELPPV